LPTIRSLKLMGFEILATSGTAEFLQDHNIPVTRLMWSNEEAKGDQQKVVDVINTRGVDMVVNVPSPKYADTEFESTHGYALRRGAVDHGIMLLTNRQVAAQWVDSMARARVLTVEPYRNPLKAAQVAL
jgi:carbamoyl-phosphate synthase/aspartate carbamoyltransferase